MDKGTDILANDCKGVSEVIVDFDLSGSQCQVGESGDFATLTVTNLRHSTESIDFTLDGPGSAISFRGGGSFLDSSEQFTIPKSEFGDRVTQR